MRLRVILTTALVLALAIIALTFSLLATTSPRWAVQQYFLGQGDQTTFTSVLCKAERSPFYRCGIPLVDADGSCSIPACHWYPPGGWDATSCRVPAEVGDVFLQSSRSNGTIGSYSECQQGLCRCLGKEGLRG